MPSLLRGSIQFVLCFLIFGSALSPGATPLVSQEIKPGLDHDDTYRWNTIRGRTLSADGKWLTYVIEPWDGDPTLVVTRTDGSAESRYRGRAAAFTRNARFVAFRVPPMKSIVDSLRREGKSGDDLPGDSLAVLTLDNSFSGSNENIFRAGPIESFSVPEDDGVFIAYLRSANTDEEKESEDREGKNAEKHSAEYEKRHEKRTGTPLVVRNLESGIDQQFENVVEYRVADAGTAVVFATSTDDGEGDGFTVVDPTTGQVTEIMKGEGHYTQPTFDESGRSVAFLSDREQWETDQPSFALYRADANGWTVEKVVDNTTVGVPIDWWLSEHGDVSFSEDGSRIFFGTAPRPEEESDKKILDADRVELDIWNWRDDYLQPMQLVRAEDERNRSFLAVVHADQSHIVQLGSKAIPDITRTHRGDGDHFLGTTDVPHRQELSWDGRYNDAYAIDVWTGERRLIVERVRGFGGANLSSGGTYAYWWDDSDRDWKATRIDGTTGILSLTSDIPFAFHRELDDHPQGPPPYGSPTWTADEEALLLYDKHDVWRTDPSGTTAPLRLTDGRASNQRYRIIRSDVEKPWVPNGEVLLSSFDMGTKGSGFSRGRTDRAVSVEQLTSDNVRYGPPTKARDADRLVWTRETFVEFPDLWVSDSDFSGAHKISEANPQQSEYRWGSAELVSWMSNDRTPLEGILIKPDGFDPSQKYPMLVYFYERMSDGLHQYQPPLPNRASIRFSFYASRGYLVFIPDIPYEIGYPGESALDAVVPGVLTLVDQGFVDPDRIGVQGHSWGGYQIAYMITKTNLFAAAEAGAPVSNMTSAYGGIRWQSGMSRMFQYERTQSRIGGTLWDERDRYIHNSPLFFADKIHTPLLMLHNDADGAVPWYQGIEMFVAMRRLSLPVFMLNYNDEGHGLGRKANQEDWAIRMQQFFDHYLVESLAARWMEEGIPATSKGRDWGLDLVEKKVPEEGREN